MNTLRFEWRNDKNQNTLMYSTKLHDIDSWLAALSKCGWDNRTSLRTTDERGYTILNWFEVSPYLPFGAAWNRESDYNFAKKNWPFN